MNNQSSSSPNNISSSFRDPSGFVFKQKGVIYRQINKSYKKNYDLLINSGLYDKLLEENLIVRHQKTNLSMKSSDAYLIIKPDQIDFISYPYEWSFNQLKDAALATLEIQRKSLDYGMSLKDASAYNIQFVDSKPVLIDTLSFEKYEHRPWVAYRQFCQHFLAPLSLMAKVDMRLGTLSQSHIDGIPLDMTSALLPKSSWLSAGLLTHIHLHAKSQLKHGSTSTSTSSKVNAKISKNQLIAIVENLKATVLSLKLPGKETEWGDYYNNTNYSKIGKSTKSKIISAWISKIKPNSVWDAGANDGTFAKIATEKNIFTVASDIDPVAVNKSYMRARKAKDKFLLPLIINLVNPSPSIGWANEERSSFLERANFDLTLCLAVIHHLAISNNLPFKYLASLLSQHTKNLIIEFVPKSDSNVKRLLASREDIFNQYNQQQFEADFSCHFNINEKKKIKDSERTLYLMKRKG